MKPRKRNSSNHFLTSIIALVFSVSLFLFVYLSFFSSTTSPELTEGIYFTSVQGKKLDINKLQGKVVLVNFWATWCPPCLYELPDLIKLKDKYGADSFEIIGVSYDDSEKTVKTFLETNPINYPIVMASDTVSSFFGDASALPTTIFLNKNLDRHIILQGYQEHSILTTIIDQLLNEKI